MKTTHSIWPMALVGALSLAALPAALGAQEARAPDTCAEGRVLGSLGITGLRCRDCAFATQNGVMVSGGGEDSFGTSRAVYFGTEPEVLGTDGSTALRPGDILVAVDGQLITTRAGAAALTGLRPDREVTLRVRRDGQDRELRVRPVARCVRPAPPAPLAPVAPLPPLAERPSPEPPDAPLPALAPGPLPVPPAAAPPAPPALAPMRPDASLGFAFECGPCHYTTSDGAWTFGDYPTVFRVETGGPADGVLQPGDEIRAVEGQDLLTEAGGRAFAAIAAGQDVRWTIRRGGETRTVRTRALAKDLPSPPTAAAAPVPPARPRTSGVSVGVPAPVSDALRYAGTLGDARIEVVGEPVSVTRVGNELIIRTRGNEIRVRLAGGPG